MVESNGDSTLDAEDERRALEHSWAWFQLHAGQRMQQINFLLVSMALIVAGYGAALQAGRPGVAAAIAIAGCAIAVCFWRLDVRTRDLVKAGEAALTVLEDRLATRVQLNELRFIARVETPRARFSAYSTVIRALVAIFVGAFLAAALYSVIAARSDEATRPPAQHHHSAR